MSTDTRRDKRAKVVSLNVRYKSATIDEFIENHSYDVSRGGLFVKTPQPFVPGTLLKFEIRIAGDKAVIAGVGRVVWKRDAAQAGPERPAGMGVKFIKVDDASRATIEKLLSASPNAGKAYLSEPEAPDHDPIAAKAPFAEVVAESAPMASKPPGPDMAATPVNLPAPKPGASQAPGTAKLGAPAPAAASPTRVGAAGAIPGATPALPLDKTPSSGMLKAATPAKVAPPARKGTMMGLGSTGAAPARGAAAPTPTPPPSTGGLLSGTPFGGPPSSSGPASEPRGARALSSPLGSGTPAPTSVVPRASAAPSAVPRASAAPSAVPRASAAPSAVPRASAAPSPDYVATRPPPPAAKAAPKAADENDPFATLEVSPREPAAARFGTTSVVTSAPMFPKGGPAAEPVGAREPTMMTQAAEFLEEALKEAGGSMDEIGTFPADAPKPAAPKSGSLGTGTLVMQSAPPRPLAEDEAARESDPELPNLDKLIDGSDDDESSDRNPYVAPVADAPAPTPGVVFGAVPSTRDVPAPPPSQESVSDLSSQVGAKRKSGAGGAVAAVLVVLLLGGAAVAAWKMGLLGPQAAQPAPTAAPSASTATTPPSATVPAASASAPASATLATDAAASASPSTVAPSASVAPAPSAGAPPEPAAPPMPKPKPVVAPPATQKPVTPPTEPTEAKPAEPKPAETSEPKPAEPKPKKPPEEDNPY